MSNGTLRLFDCIYAKDKKAMIKMKKFLYMRMGSG